MAEKRKRKQKLMSDAEPTKDEISIAKYIRFNTPKKTTVYQKQNMEYFVGAKAVDTLMASKWTKPSKKDVPLIQTRSDAVKFLQKLLSANMMYRAKKVLKESKALKDDTTLKVNKLEGDDGGMKLKKRKKGKDEKPAEKQKDGETKKTTEPAEKKKKKKYKLDVHEEQVFLDSSDLYVWIYDPLSPKKMLLGAIVVLGIIGVTLFPLWPPTVRVGVYYLSVCGGIFVGSILGVAICRSVLFVMIWGITLGKHHFWFLPNLLADVGFFDSFKPVYTHEVMKNKKDEEDKKSDSDGEDEQEDSPQDGASNPDLKEDENTKSNSGQSKDSDISPLDGDEVPGENCEVDLSSGGFIMVEADKTDA